MTRLVASWAKEKQLLEREWADLVTHALDATGWRWCFTKPSKRGHNGAPDLYAVRAPRFIAIELKREGWRGVTDDQKAWLRDLQASGIEAYVFTMPRQWHDFEAVIARPPVQESFTSNSTASSVITENLT